MLTFPLITILLLYVLKAAGRKLQTGDLKPLPTQTFFLPAPEDKLLPDLFKVINSGASNTIVTLLSVTISTDGTVIWYDEWEDGYDENVIFGVSKTTKVWGDGNALNGCAPIIKNCTNSMDTLKAGDSFVIQNDVPIPRIKTAILYDGGDRIQASMPINVNRAAYAKSPGSVLAGAIEMLDTMVWGLTFEAPVGVDLGKTVFAFELSIFMVMAGYNNTKVFLPDNTVRVLNIGQSTTFTVNQGHIIKSDKPVQVHLFTGDINSTYETRWYSLRPVETYADAYVTPVGDSMGKTKILAYNPRNTSLNYSFRYLDKGIEKTATGVIAGKQAGWSPVIPTGSGAVMNGTHPFVALTVTDSEDKAGDGYVTGGTMYDWGCPVVPLRELTSEVLLGLGYGCTNNACGST
jgi:IgGFc binding protein